MSLVVSYNSGILRFYHLELGRWRKVDPHSRHGEEEKLKSLYAMFPERQLEGAGSSRWHYSQPEVHRIIVMCINIQFDNAHKALSTEPSTKVSIT